jgi:hypothetical protein
LLNRDGFKGHTLQWSVQFPAALYIVVEGKINHNIQYMSRKKPDAAFLTGLLPAGPAVDSAIARKAV